MGPRRKHLKKFCLKLSSPSRFLETLDDVPTTWPESHDVCVLYNYFGQPSFRICKHFSNSVVFHFTRELSILGVTNKDVSDKILLYSVHQQQMWPFFLTELIEKKFNHWNWEEGSIFFPTYLHQIIVY